MTNPFGKIIQNGVEYEVSTKVKALEYTVPSSATWRSVLYNLYQLMLNNGVLGDMTRLANAVLIFTSSSYSTTEYLVYNVSGISGLTGVNPSVFFERFNIGNSAFEGTKLEASPSVNECNRKDLSGTTISDGSTNTARAGAKLTLYY